MKWEVVEKGNFGLAWSPIRYGAYSVPQFTTKEEALKVAQEFLTKNNCDNPLTKDEKFSNARYYMMTDTGCYLGILDGVDWYATYPKEITSNKDGVLKVIHNKGDVIKDQKWYELENKSVVTVREVPGT